MARTGMCKDRLADAFARFGRVPIEKRLRRVASDHPALLARGEAPSWAAGGLIHDGRGRVLLLRHTPDKGWGDAWVTPGGGLEEGETVLEGLEREVFEEAGLGIADAILSRILQENLTDGRQVRHGYFAQFIACAVGTDPRPGSDVSEMRWFDRLPEGMAFREDYLEDFRRIPRPTKD